MKMHFCCILLSWQLKIKTCLLHTAIYTDLKDCLRGETWKCIIECIWNRSLTKYHICYSNNISKAKYIIYFNQCCVHYLCSWIYLNFQHTGNFIIFLGIQNLCITFAQALANLIQTETLKSHWETQSCCGIFSTASLFAGLGTSLRWISPSVSNCLKCHSTANSPSSRLSFHCKILYHIYHVLLLHGGWGEKSKNKKERGWGMPNWEYKGFRCK